MTGLGVFTRSFLRRDRWMIPLWALAITFMFYVQAPSVDGLYPDQASFDRAAASMEQNTAFIAMAGPARALNTVGGQVAWQATAFGAILVGLMSMFLVGRHTRVEEESGRDELVRSGVVGRLAPMTAALVVMVLANTLAGVLVTASLIGYGLASPGAISLGLGLALTGICFGAIAMVAAQLTQGARAMYGLVGAVIGIAYALRAIGDVGANGLSWLSPIGWYQAMHAYSGEQWWPTLLLLALTAVALGAAYALFQRRDLGAGLLPDRSGAERASPGLLRPPGLTWRLQRWSILGWGAGLLLGGLAYGSIGDDVESLMGDSDFSRKVFTAGGGGSLVDGFYGAAAVMLALIASGFAVSSALRALAEEDSGRLEPLLSAGSSRTRWLTQQAMVTLIGTVLVMALAGLGLGVGYTLVTGHGRVIDRFAEAALAQLPGVLVLVGLTFLLYGIGGRLARMSWLALGFCAVVMFFGPLLRLPDWLTTLSPFEHLAAYPAKAVDWTPFLSLVGLSIVLFALGLVAFQRRDVQ